MLVKTLLNQKEEAPHNQETEREREREGGGDVEGHMLSSRQRFRAFGTSLAGRA